MIYSIFVGNKRCTHGMWICLWSWIDRICQYIQSSSFQLLSHVWLFATPWTAAFQAFIWLHMCLEGRGADTCVRGCDSGGAWHPVWGANTSGPAFRAQVPDPHLLATGQASLSLFSCSSVTWGHQQPLRTQSGSQGGSARCLPHRHLCSDLILFLHLSSARCTRARQTSLPLTPSLPSLLLGPHPHLALQAPLDVPTQTSCNLFQLFNCPKLTPSLLHSPIKNPTYWEWK